MKSKTAQKHQEISNAGFSLVEILLVILVAGAIILVLTNILPAINLVGVGNRELIIRQVAAEQIENIRILGYDNLSDGTKDIVDPRLGSFNQLQAQIIITPHASELKKVDIIISWDDNGKQNSFTTSTLVAKGGIK